MQVYAELVLDKQCFKVDKVFMKNESSEFDHIIRFVRVCYPNFLVKTGTYRRCLTKLRTFDEK